MKIATTNDHGIEFIAVEGEVDMSVALKLREAIMQACQRCSRGVGVDLGGVPYMDSSGLAILIEGMQWSRKEGGRFLLVGVQQRVLDTIRLARLNDFFEMYPTRSEAVVCLCSD